MAKTIVIVGTLETKGEEIRYIKELIERKGLKTIIIDGGVSGEPLFLPDISREEIAKAAGMEFRQVIASDDNSRPPEIMAEGCSRVAEQLYLEGKLDGILSLGGSMGTALATAAMRSLPFGVPKVMVSTMAAADTRPYLGTKDITMIPSVVDILGQIGRRGGYWP